MKRIIFILVLVFAIGSSTFASQSKDILYQLAREYDVEMWRQGVDGNPTFQMNQKGYEFYFKHLYRTYKAKYNTVNEQNDIDGYYRLYHKVCSLLDWKVKNKEYSRIKRYIRLKKKIETDVKALEKPAAN